MTVLRTHEGEKDFLCTALQVCAVLCEPEMPFLYPKNSEADPVQKYPLFLPEIPVHTFYFSSDSHNMCFWRSGRAISEGHIPPLKSSTFFSAFEECFLCKFLCNVGIV